MARKSVDCYSGFTFEEIQGMADNILGHTDLRPTIGIICGTGLDGLSEIIENPVTIPYESIPGFPVSTVKGHSGKFVFGCVKDKAVLLMRGRFHYYEGYPMWKVATPIRVMKALGIKTLLVTNAAGGLNQDFKTGDLMLIRDHIDLPGLTGECVLIGKNDERFGPRFVATNGTYNKSLTDKFLQVAKEMGHADIMREGVYVMVGGPTFSSVAEAKILRMYGADAVGMSTIPETIVGYQGGMKILAISLITDMVSLSEDNQFEVTHEQVLQTAKERALLMQKMFLGFIEVL